MKIYLTVLLILLALEIGSSAYACVCYTILDDDDGDDYDDQPHHSQKPQVIH